MRFLQKMLWGVRILSAVSLIWLGGIRAFAESAPMPPPSPFPTTFQIVSLDAHGTVHISSGHTLRLAGLYMPDLQRPESQKKFWSHVRSHTFTASKPLFIDRFQRPVVHLTRIDGLWLQQIMVASGQARVMLVAESGLLDCALLPIEANARAAYKGEWGVPPPFRWPAPFSTDHAVLQRDGLVMMHGTITEARTNSQGIMLFFGPHKKKSLLIIIPPSLRTHFLPRGSSVSQFIGQRASVRGWLSWAGRPTLTIFHPAQVHLTATPQNP